MADKHTHHENCSNDHNEDPDNRIEVTKRIKELVPAERIRAIALNHYLELRKDLDKEIENKTDNIQNEFDLKCIPYYNNQNELALALRPVNEDERKFIERFLKDEEKGQIEEYLNQPLPEYWSKILKQFFSNENNKSLIGERDLEIFQYLQKVDLELFEGKNDFTLYFTFSQNEYFTNTVLTKKIIYSDEKQKADYPIKSVGTKIEWKDESKNVTIKTVSKKQKNKKTGASRTVKKQVKADSFFNLFESVQNIEENDEAQEQMDKDFDLAKEFIETILPNQLELYLGIDISVEDEDFEDLDDEDGDDGDNDDDDDNSDDEKDKKKDKKKTQHRKKSGDSKGDGKSSEKGDCKQQ